MNRGSRLVDHTADLALELWADDEVGLLRAGAEAVAAIVCEDAPAGAADVQRAVTLRCVDPADRLVQWLNEVIVWAALDGVRYVDADLTLREGGLDAVLWGQSDAPLATELKAATYHDLRIERDAGGWRATVVIDV